MKHCKKFVAVLLAAVMMLAMLTACGGSSTTNPYEAKAERMFLGVWSKIFNVSASNTLRSEAAEVLNRVGSGGVINGGHLQTWSESNTSAKVAVILTSGSKAEAYPRSIGDTVLTADQERALSALGTAMTQNLGAQGVKVTNIGVAVKEIDGQLYTAVALRIQKIS